MPVQSVDVCIVGGGMVGLAAAAFIHQRRPETTLEILDSQEIKHKTMENRLCLARLRYHC